MQPHNELHHNIYNDSSLHEDDTLAQELRECFILCGTPPSHVPMILKILHKRHPQLPTDSRTLLETPKNIQVRNMGEGRYIHFGMEKELKAFIQRMSPRPNNLTLDIHIDGVNISRSSSMGLWTILCTYNCLIFSHIEMKELKDRNDENSF